MDRSYATQLSLVRLTSADSLTVVQSVLPAAGLTDSLASLILDKAEGNPFFLEELARAVGEQPPLPSGLIVPDTVHGVLAARIDRLAEVPKRLLQTASVLGREFSVRLLDAVWDGGALARRCWASLASWEPCCGLPTPWPSSGKISLPSATKGGVDLLNEAIATGGEAAEFTVPPLLAQADLLLHQSRPQEALSTARRAQQTAGQYRVWTIEAQCLEGEALVALGSSDEGERLLRDVKAKATAIEAAPLVWRASLALGDHLNAQGRHDEASAQRAEARKILDRAAPDLSADLRPSFDATRPVRGARGE
jgi:hypothetical protein